MWMPITQDTIDLLNEHFIYGTDSGVNRFKIGEKINVMEKSVYEPHTLFKTNNFYTMGSFSYSCSPLTPYSEVGRYSSIAANVTLLGYQHPYNRFTTSGITYYKGLRIYDEVLKSDSNFRIVPNPQAPIYIYIGNDVWIGANSVLKPGIKIGDGSIIGANAVVTKDVEPYTIVGGVPAKYIKHRFPMEIISHLMKIRWWDYLWTDFGINGDIPVEDFIDKMYTLIANNKIRKYNPIFLTGDEVLKTSINK